MIHATDVRINGDDAVRLLTEAVTAAGPDHIEPRRCYADESQPRCIVGHVLAAAGLDVFAIHRFTARWSGVPGMPTGGVVDARDLSTRMRNITGDACAVLQAAQDVQDAGRPWGEALRAGEDTLAAIRAQDEADEAAGRTA